MDEDDAVAVRRLSERRPVPPLRRVPAQRGWDGTQRRTPYRPRPAVRSWPVYDPFSARRHRAPEWLVNYVAALVVVDLLAAAASVWSATGTSQ